MSDDLAVLGGMVGPPEQTPGVVPASFDTGTVTEVVDDSHIKVNLGDAEVTAFVPATLANSAEVDSTVRVSTQENHRVLDSVIEGAAAGLVPVGGTIIWWTDNIPAGWLKCDGSTYSSATYPKLFAELGTTTLPDMRDLFPIGASGTKAVKSTGGASSVTISTSNMPSHTHTMAHTHEHPHTHTIAHTHTMAHDHNINHTHDIGHSHTLNMWIFNGAGASGVHYGVGFQDSTGQAFNMETNSQTNSNLVDAGGGTSGGPSTTVSGGASNSTTSAASNGSSGAASDETTGASSAANTGSSGSGSSMSILNPYRAAHFIIKAA